MMESIGQSQQYSICSHCMCIHRTKASGPAGPVWARPVFTVVMQLGTCRVIIMSCCHFLTGFFRTCDWCRDLGAGQACQAMARRFLCMMPIVGHKRSLTYRPGSQGWAPGIFSSLCVVCRILFWVGWLESFLLSFFLIFSEPGNML